MSHSMTATDDLWSAFWALPAESRDRFMERIVADAALRTQIEDLLDLALARERADEPVRPLDEVLAEIEQ